MRLFHLSIIIFIPTVFLTAAPVPKPDSEVVEEFEWKAEKIKRTVRTLTLGGQKVEFVQVPKGTFLMGAPESDGSASDDEKPQHKVTFTKPLWVGKYAVTKGQFAAFVAATKHQTDAEKDGKGGRGYDGKQQFVRDPRYDWRETGWEQTDRHPVVSVSWNDAMAYTGWASKESKKVVRLLTEAEYEYVNRAGTTTRHFAGDHMSSVKGYANLADYSAKKKWGCAVSEGHDDGEPFTAPVGKYKPNGFGLYDTTGNVWSWCANWYHEEAYAARKNGVVDPKPGSEKEGTERVVRGGSWQNIAVLSRPADKNRFPADHHYCDLGFRICAELE